MGGADVGTRGRHPREGGDGGGYWRWVKVRGGREETGWVCGDLRVYPAHMGDPSVVCTHTLTGGRVKCRWCASRRPVRDLGYLPIYRSDYVPCVLIVHEHLFDGLDRLRHLCPIIYGRAEGDEAEPLYVRPHMAGGQFHSSTPARLARQDITIAIARYWKRPDLLADLVRWFGPEAVTAPVPPAEPEPSRAAAAPPAEPSRQPSRHRERLVGEDGNPLDSVITEAQRAMLARNRAAANRPSANGEHG